MNRAAATLLTAQALRIQVGARTLIEDLAFAVDPGDVWCVLGANGAGKTLLLQTLAGLRPLRHGALRLCGTPLADWSIAAAARVRGFLPQFNPLSFSMTVVDTVAMGRHPHLPRWRFEGDDDARLANAALADVGLAALAGRDVTTLSGGERQRVAIATLLVQDAPLMLLDEPIAHLDLRHQLRVLDHLSALARQGRGVMLSIHDLTLARRCATHALLLHGDGRAVAGPVDDVMTPEALSAAFACRVESLASGGRRVFVAQ